MSRPDFSTLESAIHRAYVLIGLVMLAMCITTATALFFAAEHADTLRQLSQHLPVLVVPGAVGGIYSPGLTDDQIKATARYLANLATNFSGIHSFRERFDELETFADPSYLPRLQGARHRLEHDVDTQSQARTFFAQPQTETFSHVAGEQFSYRVRGDRSIYSSGLPLDRHESELNLVLAWGTPSDRNRAGVVLKSIDITDLDPLPTRTR
jgi:hypothetical protein